MRTILVALFLLIFFIISIPILIIEWIISKFNQPWADITQLRIVQWAFKCICFISGVKLEVIGEENVPKDEAVLYVANHRSMVDIVLTYTRCPGLTGFVAKNSIKKVPALRGWMKRLHCEFLDRDDLKQGMKVILNAISKVKHGISILPFKDGSFKIAQKTGCKIIPVAITGTNHIFEDHFPWVHKGEVIIEYGKPVTFAELSPEDQKRVGLYFQNLIQQMLIEHTKLNK